MSAFSEIWASMPFSGVGEFAVFEIDVVRRAGNARAKPSQGKFRTYRRARDADCGNSSTAANFEPAFAADCQGNPPVDRRNLINYWYDQE